MSIRAAPHIYQYNRGFGSLLTTAKMSVAALLPPIRRSSQVEHSLSPSAVRTSLGGFVVGCVTASVISPGENEDKDQKAG